MRTILNYILLHLPSESLRTHKKRLRERIAGGISGFEALVL